MKRGLLVVFSMLLFISNSLIAKENELTYKVHRAGEDGFNLASVLVLGKKEAVLIDAHFTKADAHKVVAQVLKSKRELKKIYVSHGDPDYYFGLEVITKAFPKAKIYATKQTVTHIKKTYQDKLNYWGPKLENNAPSYVLIPSVIEKDFIELEDKKLKIMNFNSRRSYVYVPSIKAIFGGINITDKEHLWMADTSTKKERKEWLKVLKDMKKLEIKTVIPAHSKEGSKNDISAIEFSIKYLETYEKAVLKAKNSKELISIMQTIYPKLDKDSFSLKLGAQVVKGEVKW
ncbi:MBL fold metallo-hydrolase [Halarcobacter sp.]|uniref:MBL fold metallo-hydrolase n=1 Tax=Halarcobacter sp. TaxID=2321133 RepID=UPI003A8EEB8F